jgi:hypothetical protein
MDKIINKGLIANPLNWLTVFAMVLIASILGHQLLALAGQQPATPQSN